MPRPKRNTRKPFGEVSRNAASRAGDDSAVSPKKNKKSKRPKAAPKPERGNARRKSRQVGDAVAVFIQERRSGDIYQAEYDGATGGYFYTPRGRKTPVAYDEARHKIVKRTPEGTSLKTEGEDDVNPASGSEEGDDKKLQQRSIQRRSVRKTRRVAVARGSYTEKSDDDDNDDGEEEDNDQEGKPKKRSPNKHGGKNKRSRKADSEFEGSDFEDVKPTGAEARAGKALSKKNKKAKTSKQPTLDEDDAFMKDVVPDDNPDLARFASPFGKTDWQTGEDWRASSAIDY